MKVSLKAARAVSSGGLFCRKDGCPRLSILWTPGGRWHTALVYAKTKYSNGWIQRHYLPKTHKLADLNPPRYRFASGLAPNYW